MNSRKPHTHFVVLARNQMTGCGRRMLDHTSHIPELVTCKQCKRSRVYQAGVAINRKLED